MEQIMINDFAKGCLLEDNKAIKSFIKNFKGGEGDAEDYEALMQTVSSNRLAIPVQIQDKLDLFIHENLEPMVFEHNRVFAESRSVGYLDDDGIQHIDDEKDVVHMLAAFYSKLFEIEEKWDSFAMEELHPYFML